MTGLAKRGLIHASNFSTVTRHNSACSPAANTSKFCGMNVATLDKIVTKTEINCFTTH